jgi:hypothetical protein
MVSAFEPMSRERELTQFVKAEEPIHPMTLPNATTSKTSRASCMADE